MQELVRIVNGVMRIKDADIMHVKGIGPRGTHERHWVVLRTRGPHDFGPKYWDSLNSALQAAGFSTKLDKSNGKEPPNGVISISRGKKSVFYITLNPANQAGDIEIHYAAQSSKHTLTSRQHLELSLDIGRLLRQKLHND